jgi:hypothetical protein
MMRNMPAQTLMPMPAWAALERPVDAFLLGSLCASLEGVGCVLEGKGDSDEILEILLAGAVVIEVEDEDVIFGVLTGSLEITMPLSVAVSVSVEVGAVSVDEVSVDEVSVVEVSVDEESVVEWVFFAQKSVRMYLVRSLRSVVMGFPYWAHMSWKPSIRSAEGERVSFAGSIKCERCDLIEEVVEMD